MNQDISAHQDHIHELKKRYRKFRHVCAQIVMLNNNIAHAQVRYRRARTHSRKSFRYFQRVNLAVIEGVRNMLYEHASTEAVRLERLQNHLIRQGVNLNGVLTV